MNILDHISESLETMFGLKILKLFDADPGSGIFFDPDPGWKNSDPRSGINIRDSQHWFESDLSAYSKKPRSGRELNNSENSKYFSRLLNDESASVTISTFVH